MDVGWVWGTSEEVKAAADPAGGPWAWERHFRWPQQEIFRRQQAKGLPDAPEQGDEPRHAADFSDGRFHWSSIFSVIYET
jgi:hypothetical protein